MFENLTMPKPDALHGVTAKYEADLRPEKIDLGVGVYKDWTGASPIMDCVRVASERLVRSEQTKSYLSLKGHEGFIEQMQRLIGPSSLFSRVACVQSVGGTGGISLALEMAKLANPNLVVHIGMPTWPNHVTLANRLNLKTNLFEYFDVQSQSIQYDHLRSAIDQASKGDVLIFNGPCHNPTGADLCENSYWDLLKPADQKGVVTLIDTAYYGLGNELENDLHRLRETMEKMSRGFVVMSCSKSFGLYRERTGILFAITPSEAQKRLVQARLEMIADISTRCRRPTAPRLYLRS